MRLRLRLEPEKYVALQPRLPEQYATTEKGPETGVLSQDHWSVYWNHFFAVCGQSLENTNRARHIGAHCTRMRNITIWFLTSLFGVSILSHHVPE